MKRIYLILTAVSFLFITSCKKGEINGAFESQRVGSYLTKVASGNIIIDYSNLASAKVDVTVKEYGEPVDKIKIFVSKGAASTNTALWKAVKEVPYSGETKLEVTATEIAQALGIPPSGLETGATYTLYNQVIGKNGDVFDITNTNSVLYGNPNYNALMTWQAVVVCPFRAADWGGVGASVSARVLQDDWADYSPGEIIDNIRITGATELTFDNMWKTSPVLPVKVTIDGATGAATVPKQVYGDYGASFPNFSCQSSGTNNWVFSCANQITLTLTHRDASGASYGTYILRLQKL